MANEFEPLSERELEVMRLVAEGKTNQQIARALVISPNTVKVHLRNIFEKLGVQSRTEATMEAVRRGWVNVPGTLTAAADTVPTEIGAGGRLEETPALPLESFPTPAPIARWQRVYMIGIAILIALVALAPTWLSDRSQAARLTPFSDLGRPQSASPPRAPVSRWVARASLPEGRSRMAVATDSGRLYVIAGETATGITDQVSIYDLRSNSWQTAATKPTAVANIAAVWLGDRLYVAGGTLASGAVTDTVEVYAPQADAWSEAARLPFPLAAYGAAALDGKLYLFGGWDGARYRTDTLIYDPAEGRWATGTAMAEPRAFHAASALQGVIYVVGGFDGERELATVAVYDPAGEGTTEGPWASRAALGQPRGGLGLAALGARLYAIGGGWTEVLTFNEQYDVRADAWSRIETPFVGRWRNLGVAALGNKIYAVGGWSGSYLSSNEEYLALLQQLLPLFTTGQ